MKSHPTKELRVTLLVFTCLNCMVQQSHSQPTHVYANPRNKTRKSPTSRTNQKSQQQSTKQKQPFSQEGDEDADYFSFDSFTTDQPSEEEQNFEQEKSKHNDNDNDHGDQQISWNEFWKDPDTQKAVQVLWKSPKPRGVLHAAWMATKSTSLGFLLGTTSLLTFPTLSMWLMNSWSHVAISSVLGGVVGVAAMAFGIRNGICHCMGGIAQIPKSFESWWNDDLVWNPDNFGAWETYNLQDHAKQLSTELGQGHQSSTFTSWKGYGGSGNTSEKADDEINYYHILEVPVTATKSEIKRAYYSKAKELHPDKNPNLSIASSEQFLQLHTAYQTLSDDDKRAVYDEWGKMPEGNLSFDIGTLFSVIFDSYSMEAYTGPLDISSWMIELYRWGLSHRNPNSSSSEGDSESTVDRQDLKKLMNVIGQSNSRSQKRQVDIAMHLKDTIEPYVSGMMKEGDFRDWAREEAKRMVQNGIFVDQDGGMGSAQHLKRLGKGLENAAAQYRGFHRLVPPFGWTTGILAWSQRKLGRASNSAQIYFRVVYLLKQIIQQARMPPQSKEGTNEDRFRVQLTAMLPLWMNVAQNYNALDIQRTMDGACWRLFRDSGVPKSERFLRSKAIQVLGQEFAKYANEHIAHAKQRSDSPNMDLAQRLEIALSIAKANA